MTSILTQKQSVYLFDEDALSMYQFSEIIKSADQIHSNESSMVIMLRENDTESLGMLKILSDSYNPNNVRRHENALLNSFTKREADQINLKISNTDLPIYSVKKNEKFNEPFLNYLIRSGSEQNECTKFSEMKLLDEKEKSLVFYIAIASKRCLYYSEIVQLDLTKNALDIEKRMLH